MSEGNICRVPENIRSVFQRAPEFRPCFIHLSQLDHLIILEEDCSYTEEREPNSAIGILTKNHDEGAGKVVGICIYNYSQWKRD